jgi:crotonobetainyl-CoA:carnitine CoA-transferase CaiB-like acyl-CoA transferase
MVDMFGANAQANHDDFLSYPGKNDRAMPDELLLGLSPTYRLYPCAEDSWVFLALVTDADRTKFEGALEEAGLEAPATAQLADAGPETIELLTALFAQKPADDWQQLFAAAGVGCLRADGLLPSSFWLKNEQVSALGLTAAVEHPEWGSYRRHGPLLHFDGLAPDLKPPPLAGQHNDELLRQLGET